MSVKELRGDESLVAKSKEFTITHDGKELAFIAREIGYMESQNMSIKASRGDNGLSLIVAASITDKDGNHFTYDEVQRMKEDVASRFLDEAIAINKREEASDKKK